MAETSTKGQLIFPASSKERILLLIDSSSLIYRCFFALPPLTTPEGEPIQAIYGLANIFLKVWGEERPDFAAALFDRPEPTFREKEYKEYKAQRPAPPSELISQIGEAHNFFKKFGIQTFEKPGFEADDLVATLASKFENESNLKIIILSGDLDNLQLVKDGKIVVRTFKKGLSETMIYDEKAVEERYGLKPAQLIDYKALVGDPSDNIKGVSGVGPKTAVKFLQKYQNLENIFLNLKEDQDAEKKFGGHESEAVLAKKLVILDHNVPVELGGLDELKVEEKPMLIDYFRKLGFTSILKRMEKE